MQDTRGKRWVRNVGHSVFAEVDGGVAELVVAIGMMFLVRAITIDVSSMCDLNPADSVQLEPRSFNSFSPSMWRLLSSSQTAAFPAQSLFDSLLPRSCSNSRDIPLPSSLLSGSRSLLEVPSRDASLVQLVEFPVGTAASLCCVRRGGD